MKNGTCLTLIVALLCTYRPTYAQESGDVDDDVKEELKELKENLEARKEIINAQKDLLVAEKELLAARYPKIEGGKDGVVEFKTGSADSLHAHILATEALQAVAKQICDKIKAVHPLEKKIALLSSEDLKSVVQYRVIDQEITHLESDMKTAAALEMRAIGTAMYGAALTLNTIAGFTKLFRSNKAIYAESTAVSDAELNDMLAYCIGERAEYPAAKFDAIIASGVSTMLTRAKALDEKRAEINQGINSIEKITKENRTKDQEIKLGELKALISRHDKLNAAMTATEDSTKTPILLYLLRGEVVSKAVPDLMTPILTAKITKQGGFTLVSSSNWRSDKIYNSGGVIVSYRLANEGKILATGSVSAESDFVEMQMDFKKAVNPASARELGG